MKCWGGATFDVAYRFLQECPWQRLRDLRAALPNIMTQMLLRASNGVGYTNYPDNVVRGFVRQAAETGVDVFRVFDSLNWVENMRVAMDAVIETGKVCEGTICYTGNILDPDRAKYDLKYYVAMAKDLEAAGAHVLGLKDMAGLLKPAAARKLVTALREEVDLPIHFHTHDTAGVAIATILAAAESGVHAVDCAMDALSGNTSQATMGSVVESPRRQRAATRCSTSPPCGRSRTTGRRCAPITPPSRAGFRPRPRRSTLHEMPGGQFTNLKAQARSLGLEERWHEVAQTYAEVNRMFGDIVKVTPSSKVVGDMALMMVSQGLTREQVEDPAVDVSFPDSVIDMMRGNLGQPPGGWPEGLLKKVLKDEAPSRIALGHSTCPRQHRKNPRGGVRAPAAARSTTRYLMGYLMYPKVFTDYARRNAIYGPVRTLPTHIFFYGMKAGEEASIEIEPGKTLEVRLQAIGDVHEDGDVRVFFELNGQPRVIRVPDRKVQSATPKRPKAEEGNPAHVGAPMPGVVATVAAQAGKAVKAGDLLLTIEAMKMETGLHAERDATVKAVHVQPGGQIDAKDLLIEFD